MRKILIIMLMVTLSGCANLKQSSFNIGIGGAYLPDPPASHLTGKKQFHISAFFDVPVTDHLYFRGGWNHFSNGAGLKIGQHPNKGLDAVGGQFILKLN